MQMWLAKSVCVRLKKQAAKEGNRNVGRATGKVATSREAIIKGTTDKAAVIIQTGRSKTEAATQTSSRETILTGISKGLRKTAAATLINKGLKTGGSKVEGIILTGTSSGRNRTGHPSNHGPTTGRHNSAQITKTNRNKVDIIENAG